MEADRKHEDDLKLKISNETGMVEQEDVEDEADAMQFEEYEPSFTKGKPHPDILVQASSLASYPLPPLTYQLNLPTRIFTKGLLSNPQLETVVLACQAHEQMFKAKDEKGVLREFRKGFYIGNNNNA